METPVEPAVLFLGWFLPASQKKPFLPFDHIAHFPPFTEELGPPHLVHRVVGVLDNVELVIDDAAPWNPLLQAEPEGLPHIDARRLDPFPLPADQLPPKEIFHRLLLPLPAKPQWLRRLQIAHYRKELALLAPVDFVHPHLS